MKKPAGSRRATRGRKEKPKRLAGSGLSFTWGRKERNSRPWTLLCGKPREATSEPRKERPPRGDAKKDSRPGLLTHHPGLGRWGGLILGQQLK